MFEWDSNIECTQCNDHNGAKYVWLRPALDECGPQWILAAAGAVATGDVLSILTTDRTGAVRVAVRERAGSSFLTVVIDCGPQWLTVDRSQFWQALTERGSSCSDRGSYCNWLRTVLDECDPQSVADILLGAIWAVHCWLRPAVIDCDPQSKAAENSFWFFI